MGELHVFHHAAMDLASAVEQQQEPIDLATTQLQAASGRVATGDPELDAQVTVTVGNAGHALDRAGEVLHLAAQALDEWVAAVRDADAQVQAEIHQLLVSIVEDRPPAGTS